MLNECTPTPMETTEASNLTSVSRELKVVVGEDDKHY